MKLLNEKLETFVEKKDILARGVFISNRKKTHPEVINATLGVMYDDNGCLAVLPIVKEIRALQNDYEVYPYVSTTGPVDFAKSLISFVFGQYEKEVIEKKYIEVLPTPGATGAINTAMSMFCNPNDSIIIPKLCWGVYENMASSIGLKVVEYDYIVDSHFDLDGFKKCVDEISKTQKRICTILNDPCNNPASYSLTHQELLDLFAYMESKKDVTFSLIYDVAYYEYARLGGNDSRKKFSLLKHAPSNVFTVLAWSASKAFTIYGVRIGAMMMMHEDKDSLMHYSNIARSVGRTRWSCVSASGQNLILKIINDPILLNRFTSEVDVFQKLLLKRALIIEQEAKEVSLEIIPYGGGFFIAIRCENCEAVCDELEKHDIYVIPFNGVIRIAICGITSKECEGLASKIKECMLICEQK